MSGWSEALDCPYCGSEGTLEAFGERCEVGGTCLECGYSYHTVEEQLTLEQVNEERKELDMEPLTELKPNSFKEENGQVADGNGKT
jgi:Zn ribbon nucleic-acid-binding protein